MEPYLSVKFFGLSFSAASVVVSIHCIFGQAGTFQIVYLSYFTKWAVPCFFLVSGLFLRLGLENTMTGYAYHVTKKLKTLVMPYVLWCLIGVVARYPIIMQEPNELQSGWMSAVDVIFGVTNMYPIGAGVLWFVRSLIVFQLVTPILFGCFSRERKFRFGCWGVVAVGGGLMFIPGYRHFVLGLSGTPSSPFYFLAGVILAPWILKLPSLGRGVVLGAWGGLLAVFGSIAIMHFYPGVGRHLLTLAIITTLWFGFDLFFGKKESVVVPDWCKCTFFVYCCHHVPLEYVKIGLMKLNAHLGLAADWYFLALILLAPPFFFWFAYSFKRLLPRTYAVLAGGR